MGRKLTPREAVEMLMETSGALAGSICCEADQFGEAGVDIPPGLYAMMRSWEASISAVRDEVNRWLPDECEPVTPTPEAEPAEDADGWIEWGGGECPVRNGAIVDVRTSSGGAFTHASD